MWGGEALQLGWGKVLERGWLWPQRGLLADRGNSHEAPPSALCFTSSLIYTRLSGVKKNWVYSFSLLPVISSHLTVQSDPCRGPGGLHRDFQRCPPVAQTHSPPAYMSGTAFEGTLNSWVQGLNSWLASCWHPLPQAACATILSSQVRRFLCSFICSQSTYLSSGATEVSKSHQRSWVSVFCFPWCFDMMFKKNCSLFFIVEVEFGSLIFWKFLCMLFC